MILETAVLDIKPGMHKEFEKAFAEAQLIITSMPGYINHQLQKAMVVENRYLLLVNWQTLEDHTQGFRNSPQYQQWKTLLHGFYQPFPPVEHYQLIEHCSRN